MKNFKDLGIVPTIQSFTGDKIKIDRVLNQEIVILDYKIEPSNYPEKGDGKRLVLQFLKGDNKHILFTGSMFLKDTIIRISKDDFPLKTVIVKINDHYEFT